MLASWDCLMLSICYSHVALQLTTADGNTSANFIKNRKLLQCHKTKSTDVRSVVECALYCIADLYSCAGYVLLRSENKTHQCDVCFIYDLTTPLVTINRPPHVISGVREINKEDGRIACRIKSPSQFNSVK